MEEKIKSILEGYKNQNIDLAVATEQLKNLNNEDLGFVNIDHNRAQRQGFAEVVYCAGKTPEQSAAIISRLSLLNDNVLGTRADEATYQAVAKILPQAQYNSLARTITISKNINIKYPDRKILVVSAGTSDIPVAEEAVVTARIMGNAVDSVYDVGVAGIHRLLGKLPQLQEANVLIVVAGMEGALASVVGGLVNKPVIAVPTSVGYGANFQGLSALLGMLNSCSAGVAVVNIDNGFGAGRMASIINNMN